MKPTCYLAGYIESAVNSAGDWRKEVEDYFQDTVLIYNPIRHEKVKTGKSPLDHVNYVAGLKKSGKYHIFDLEMDKIWLGSIKRTKDLTRLFKLLRDRYLIDGNKPEDLPYFGDYEAVARSDFIIAYMPHKVKTIGTIGEIFEAMLLNIPIYLIIDTPKTETNSTLLYWVRYSEGEIFYNLKDCCNYIKDRYHLKIGGKS